MSKILIMIIILGGVGGYFYYQQSQLELAQQREKVAAFAVREEAQAKTITALQENLEKTTKALNNLSEKNAAIEAEMNSYLDIFKRHNLAKLAAAKPGLIETRINKGTQDVFKSIEDDTTIVDSTDN